MLAFGSLFSRGDLRLGATAPRDGTKPTGRLIAYREYKAGERSAAEHCYYLMKGDGRDPPEPRIPTCAGARLPKDSGAVNSPRAER